MAPKKFCGEAECALRLGLAVGLPALARKGVVGAGIFVDRDERIGREAPFQEVIDLGLHPAVAHRHVQHEGPMQVRHLANIVLDIGAVIGDGAIDVAAAAHEIAELAAKAVADRADLAVAVCEAAQEGGGVLHVAHTKVVVEIVIEVEGLADMVRIAVGELDSRLLSPEQARHQAYEPRLGEFMGVVAHRVVDAPDLHDGDDGTRRPALGEREISPHLAVAERHPDVLTSHGPLLRADTRPQARRSNARASGLSLTIIPTLGWRALFAVGVIPALLLYFVRRHMPESVRYLMSREI